MTLAFYHILQMYITKYSCILLVQKHYFVDFFCKGTLNEGSLFSKICLNQIAYLVWHIQFKLCNMVTLFRHCGPFTSAEYGNYHWMGGHYLYLD